MKIEPGLLPYIFTYPGFTSPLWKYGLIDRSKNFEELFESVEKLFQKSKLDEIIKGSQASYENSIKNNIKLVKYYDNEYPALLKEIPQPPLCLFYKGNLGILKKDLIGIVGTRKPSPISLAACYRIPEFIKRFQNSGIVSGLATGIDRNSMLACIEKSIPVIGIMGTGFDKTYPSVNKDLYKLMSSNNNSLILTEMRWGEFVGKWSFPKRNRIITGLCKTLFIMELPIVSGAMSSATHAISQNREVIIFDHPESMNNEGGRKLISEGAHSLSLDDLENGKTKLVHVSELFPKDLNQVHEYLGFISNLELNGVLKDRGGGFYELQKEEI